MADNHMVLEVASVAENVGLARIAVAAFAARLPFTLAEIEEIKVAVSEAVTNAIVHGYDLNPGRTVRIEARRQGDALEIVVADGGKGIADLQQARQPSFSTDPERSGLGFLLMEQFMDALAVDTALQHGTRVRMAKRPAPREQAVVTGGG